MNRVSSFELRSIRTLTGNDAIYGKGMYEMDLSGKTKRQADAFVRDQIAGGSIWDDDMIPTECQKSWISKYGHEIPPSRVQAQALISDIAEQLDWDVIAFEDLGIGTKVVHVRRKNEPLVIKSLKPGQKCKFEGTSFVCDPRMLRRYRADGDYSRSSIPKEYFVKGWLER